MCVESGIGIACGCLPGCKPLMNRLFPTYFAATSNSSDQYPRRWQHNHAKQVDDEESTLHPGSIRSDLMRLTSPKTTQSEVAIQSAAALQQSSSRQTRGSISPVVRPGSSTLVRSTSITTSRTVNTNSMRTPNLHRSPSHRTQSSFTTTITAQAHHSRSKSRYKPLWSSVDLNKPLPLRPAPPAVAARRPSENGLRRSRNTSKELSTISNASTEMFILQGRDSGSGKQSPERKNDVWMG